MRHFFTVLAGATALSLFGCSCLDDEVAAGPNEPTVSTKECGGYVLIPATYETVGEQVTVQQAGVTKLHVDPTYQTCRDTQVETPGHWVETSTVAVNRQVNEQVLVTPARKEWQKTTCADVGLRAGEQRGDSYCLVEIPAVYETRTRSVCSTPASTNRQWVAPVYKTTERQVMVTAGYDKEVPVEARTETRTKQVLVAEARWEWRWGTACPKGEMEAGTPANMASPAPPFSVGGVPMRNRGDVVPVNAMTNTANHSYAKP